MTSTISHIMKLICKSTSAVALTANRNSAILLMLMLEKELLSGLCVRPECRSFCCHFHTRPCLTLLFHRASSSHHFRCDPALSVFASKCQVNVMPGWLLFVISGILAGGIPGFGIELCCFLHPLNRPLVFLACLFVLVSFGVIIIMAHKLSSCMN